LRGTDGFNDDGIAHGLKLEHVLVTGKTNESGVDHPENHGSRACGLAERMSR